MQDCGEFVLYTGDQIKFHNHRRSHGDTSFLGRPGSFVVKDDARIEQIRDVYFGRNKKKVKPPLPPPSKEPSKPIPKKAVPVKKSNFKPIEEHDVRGERNKQYGCPYCNHRNSFLRTWSHMNTMHQFSMWFTCLKCDDKLLFGHNILASHLKRAHPDPKDHYTLKHAHENIIKDEFECSRLRLDFLKQFPTFSDEASVTASEFFEVEEDRGTPVGDTTFENLLETMADDDSSHQDAPDQLTKEDHRLDREEELVKITGFVEDKKDFRPLPVQKDKSSRCPYCYQTFSNKNSMKTHVNVRHELTRLYQCPICDVIYPQPQKAVKHCMEAHETEVKQVIFQKLVKWHTFFSIYSKTRKIAAQLLLLNST